MKEKAFADIQVLAPALSQDDSETASRRPARALRVEFGVQRRADQIHTDLRHILAKFLETEVGQKLSSVNFDRTTFEAQVIGPDCEIEFTCEDHGLAARIYTSESNPRPKRVLDRVERDLRAAFVAVYPII